jgi:hypothetical protein
MLRRKGTQMEFQILSNFIGKCLRKNDIFIPSMILYLIKNNGEGSVEQISRLLYIFDFKHDISYYDTIVKKFSAVMLKEYNIIEETREDFYKLKTWPLTDEEIEKITKECMIISNGFFSHLKNREEIRG